MAGSGRPYYRGECERLSSGSGQLRNIDNGASALALLENVDGKLVLGSSATISTSSDLSVIGRLQFSSPATLSVHGNLEFGDVAIFSGTFGYLYKERYSRRLVDVVLECR